MQDELLVIFSSAAPGAAETLAAKATVLQQAGDRVFLVAGTDAESLRNAPGVAFAAEVPPPNEAIEGLTEEEQLFVDAWLLRRTQTKSREGEGLDWDAEGFEQP